MEKAPGWTWFVLIVVSIFLIILGLGGGSSKSQAYRLKVGEEIPTVEVGPGTYHLLCSNKPYIAVSVQEDGSRKLYNMPTRETWTGGEPAGKLRLIGKEEGTIVEISPLR